MNRRYPFIADGALTDWYAGAEIAFDDDPPDGAWDHRDVRIAFSDIGPMGDGLPSHGQLVIYAVDPTFDHPGRALSAEIDPADAREIARALLAWADAADDERFGPA